MEEVFFINRFFGKLIWIVALLSFLIFSSLVVSAKPKTPKTIYFDGMETAESWTVGGQVGTNSYLNSIPGKVGQAIEIGYEFILGSWVQMQKKVSPLNIEEAERLEFYYKGSCSTNTLQVKLVDADGTTFGRDFSGATNTKNLWKQLTVPIAELRYFWGEDRNLDRANIEKIFFAITREEGGKGTVVVD